MGRFYVGNRINYFFKDCDNPNEKWRSLTMKKLGKIAQHMDTTFSIQYGLLFMYNIFHKFNEPLWRLVLWCQLTLSSFNYDVVLCHRFSPWLPLLIKTLLFTDTETRHVARFAKLPSHTTVPLLNHCKHKSCLSWTLTILVFATVQITIIQYLWHCYSTEKDTEHGATIFCSVLFSRIAGALSAAIRCCSLRPFKSPSLHMELADKYDGWWVR